MTAVSIVKVCCLINKSNSTRLKIVYLKYETKQKTEAFLIYINVLCHKFSCRCVSGTPPCISRLTFDLAKLRFFFALQIL